MPQLKERLTTIGKQETVPALTGEEVRGVAEQTRELMETQGWCLWRCETLHGEVIVVLRDELVDAAPPGYPVYTLAELQELEVMDNAAIRLVHEAKKSAGAKVIQEEA